MEREVLQSNRENIRRRLLAADDTRTTNDDERRVGETAAELLRCPLCCSWWGVGDHRVAEARQLWQWVEPQKPHFLWESYHGWRAVSADSRCPNCGEGRGQSELALLFGENGQMTWLVGAALAASDERLTEDASSTAPAAADLFRSYITGSKGIEENVAAIEAKEAKREANAWGYTADVGDIRDDMDRVSRAFKDVVYSYAALLPPGWRIFADFEKWIAGKACAGFMHGDMSPDMSLLIGGDCTSVADIEMRLDALYQYVCACS